MALDSKIVGSTSGNGAEVNAANQLKVTAETAPGTNPGNVGAFKVFYEADAGAETGSARLKSPEVSQDYRLRMGLDTVIFRDTFNATTQNTNVWAYTLATLTATQGGAGTVQFGTVQGTTNAHGAFMRTWQYFPLIGTAPLALEFTFGQFTIDLVTNEIWRCGLGLPTTAVASATDGVWVELTTSGLVGVLSYSGTPVQTGVLAELSEFATGQLYKISIIVGERLVEFWKDDVLLGTLAVANGTGQPYQQPSLPIFLHKYNTGNVSSTNTMRVSDVTVSLMDLGSNKSWAEQLAVMGFSGSCGQNGHTMGQTTQWSNTAVATAATATNTTAALGTGLGGQFNMNAPATSATDLIVSSYLNPVPTINISGRNLLIKGVWVDCTNLVAVVATTGTTFALALKYGHTALTLATSETGSFVTATAKAPRTVALGSMYWPVGAVVGAPPTNGMLYATFTSPLVVHPGQYVAVVAKTLLGTATATETFLFQIGFDAYFE